MLGYVTLHRTHLENMCTPPKIIDCSFRGRLDYLEKFGIIRCANKMKQNVPAHNSLILFHIPNNPLVLWTTTLTKEQIHNSLLSQFIVLYKLLATIQYCHLIKSTSDATTQFSATFVNWVIHGCVTRKCAGLSQASKLAAVCCFLLSALYTTALEVKFF